MSQETLRKLAMQVRNWGRWGPDDQIGTLNHITPESIAGACRLATSGKVFALGIPLQRQGPQSGTRQRIFFLEELATDCAADGRYAFLLVAPPLPVTGGVGTPINPYAVK